MKGLIWEVPEFVSPGKKFEPLPQNLFLILGGVIKFLQYIWAADPLEPVWHYVTNRQHLVFENLIHINRRGCGLESYSGLQFYDLRHI